MVSSSTAVAAPPATVSSSSAWASMACGTETPADDSLAGDLSVEVRSAREVSAEFAADWDDLAQHASVPNPFYERWNVSAALEHLTPAETVQLAVVYRRPRNAMFAPRLCGLFPLIRARCHRLPVTAWRLWGHDYVFLRTPLVRAGQEREVLGSFLDWWQSDRGSPAALDWPAIDGEGDFAQALIDVLLERRLIHTVFEVHTRAMLRRSPHWAQTVAKHISSHHRREFRRQLRRLQEQGHLELRILDDADAVPAWTEAFLKLEGAGWKGASSTALAVTPASRTYFEKLSRSAFAFDRLQALGLFLNQEPIALKVNFLGGDGGYGFKIAYDERWAKFSPGVQLELENVRLMHESTALNWMDSCAVSQHFMINRLWPSRRTIQHLLISSGRLAGNLAVGALPLLRAAKRSLIGMPAAIESPCAR